METITMPNSMITPLPHSHEADVSDVLSLFSDPSMSYMGLGSGNNMNIGLGLGSGSGNNMNIGLGMGSGSGMNVGLGMGSGSGMSIGMGSNSGPTLIISPANSTASSPSLSHLSRNGVIRERSRDSSSSLSSMDETLGLSPNTLANFLNQPGSRTSGGSDNGSGHNILSASPVTQTLVISPGSSLTQALPIPTPPVLSPPHAPDPRVNSPPLKSMSNSSGNNSANGANKKRKRPKVAEKSEVISNWETFYSSKTESFNLYNESQLDIMNTFDLDVKIDSGNAVYSDEDNAWIFYRQNQFQIVTELLGSLSNYTPKGTTTTTITSKKTSTSPPSTIPPSGECILYVEVADYLRKVESLAMDIRIIKQTRNNLLNGIIEEDIEDKANQVKIFKVGMSRTKKENKSVEPISFVQGKATQTKLQFQSATANNAKMQAGVPNPNQQYFRLVVSIVAKIYGSEDYLHVMSKLSPPIIVRGQSPGRYPHQNQTESANEWRPGSLNGEDVMTYAGKVGVNTANPLEALTVHGNILVTGNIVKPSDVRLKSDFDEVRTDSQLKNIEKLKIYDYNIKNPLGSGEKRERGVIAQEVQEAIPNAVHVLGDVTLENDTHVPNLLVVNDHVLLLENIGATKHLSELLREEQENIKEIDSQLKDLEASTEESESVVTTKLLSVLDYIASEESLENQRHCYCSFFGLGPAWSLFLLGFVFTGITWIFGIFYICSTNHVKRVAGVANLIMAVVLVTYYIILGLYGFAPEIIIFTTAGLIAIGAICMLVMSLYGRRRSLERQAALRQIKNILIQRYTNAKSNSNSKTTQANSNPSTPRESTPLLVKNSTLDDSDDSIEGDDNV